MRFRIEPGLDSNSQSVDCIAVWALLHDVACVPAAAARARVRPATPPSRSRADREDARRLSIARRSVLRLVDQRRDEVHEQDAYRVRGKTFLAKESARVRGQQKIDSERAQAIQEALIREHYLSGEATGTWNQASEEAMRRYQADHGWQSKTVPDSRALIKLGLGPSKDHLLNPESAMTTCPTAASAIDAHYVAHRRPDIDPAPAPVRTRTILPARSRIRS